MQKKLKSISEDDLFKLSFVYEPSRGEEKGFTNRPGCEPIFSSNPLHQSIKLKQYLRPKLKDFNLEQNSELMPHVDVSRKHSKSSHEIYFYSAEMPLTHRRSYSYDKSKEEKFNPERTVKPKKKIAAPSPLSIRRYSKKRTKTPITKVSTSSVVKEEVPALAPDLPIENVNNDIIVRPKRRKSLVARLSIRSTKF